ncbi:uncharacterized protein LOC132311816 isoform X2 [Cornus florida]|uniref:uncharacterized protein LOC132311816 isoform X2 n=1 Tax=Cornus florida TaxID=4283 RepID=UPI0028A28350|nr:uncharacterized protein LOC132311816 isoform X2 [Cornus florida]
MGGTAISYGHSHLRLLGWLQLQLIALQLWRKKVYHSTVPSFDPRANQGECHQGTLSVQDSKSKFMQRVYNYGSSLDHQIHGFTENQTHLPQWLMIWKLLLKVVTLTLYSPQGSIYLLHVITY